MPFLLISSLIFIVFAIRFWFVCDDAFISFAYSLNLAEGNGLRFNVASAQPIEGYSNFLWVVVAAFFEFLGVKSYWIMPFLSILSGLFLVWRFSKVLDWVGYTKKVKFFSLLAISTFPPLFVWATSGLATLPLLALIFYIYELLLVKNEPRKIIIPGILLVLIRVEGFLWLFGIVLTYLVKVLLEKEKINKLLFKSLLIIFAVFAVYLLGKYFYFSEVLANTVHAKSGLSAFTIERGYNYVAVYFLSFLSPFLLFYGLFVIKLWPPLIMSFGAILYAILVGGDFMTMGRFLLPIVPFLFLIVADLFSRFNKAMPFIATALIIVQILPAFNFHLVPKEFRSRFHFRLNSSVFRSEYEQWQYMKRNSTNWGRLARALKQHTEPGQSLVAGAIGNLGYFSGLHIYDRFGLVTKLDVESGQSRSPGHDQAVSAAYFLSQKPDYLGAQLVSSDKPVKLQKTLAKWRKHEKNGYKTEIKDLDDKKLLLLRRNL